MLSLLAWSWYQRFEEHAMVCVASCRLVLRAHRVQCGYFQRAAGFVLCCLWSCGTGRGGCSGGVSSAAIVRERWPYREALHGISVPPYHVKRIDPIHLLLHPPTKIPDTMDSMWHSLLWQASLVTEGPPLGEGSRRVSEAQRKHPIFLTAKPDLYKCTILMGCLFRHSDILKLRKVYAAFTVAQLFNSRHVISEIIPTARKPCETRTGGETLTLNGGFKVWAPTSKQALLPQSIKATWTTNEL